MHGGRGFIAGALALVVMLAGCVELAKSADVPPELMPKGADRRERNAKGGAPAIGSAVASAVSAMGSAASAEASAPVFGAEDSFFDLPDAPIRTALANEAITKVEKGRGGRSLGFRITLESGQRGYFKGEQTFSAANWFGEVASYHLDRMLGLHRVPAVISRQLPWAKLAPSAGGDPRRAEMIIRNGQVRGAFVAWVEGELTPMEHQEGWERWIRVKYWPSTVVTPFQRPAVWKSQLDQARLRGQEWRTKEQRVRLRSLHPEPARPDRPAELSDLVIFDYLTRNLDRWGGENANVLIRGARGPIVFLDNGAAFEPGQTSPGLMEARLHVIQRFRRSTIEAVRAFDVKKFEARLATETITPVLTRAQLVGLEQRRKALLEWVAEMGRVNGEAIWAWE